MEWPINHNPERKYVKDGKTYFSVNGYTFGTFYDVVTILEERLNLSINLFRQETQEWGDAYVDSNGSIITTELVGDIFWKRADIAATSMSFTRSRADFLSFLTPIATEDLNIVVPRKTISESLDFAVFLKPLHLHMWLVILGMVIVITLTKSLTIERFDSSAFLRAAFTDFWATIVPFLGGASENYQSSKESYKVIVLTTLLSGYMIWTSYNAFLTSELLVIDKAYPFTDLESLSKTSWRLYTTASRGSGIGSALLKSNHPTYSIVYQNNMDNESFIGVTKGIDKILKTPKSAYLHYEEIQNCIVESIPWKKTVGYVTMALSKDSPYKQFMDKVILDIMESGNLKKSRLKWFTKETDCQTETNPISFQKVILIFVSISAGMILAIVILIYECLLKQDKPKPKYSYIREELKVCMETIRDCRPLILNDRFRNLIRTAGLKLKKVSL